MERMPPPTWMRAPTPTRFAIRPHQLQVFAGTERPVQVNDMEPSGPSGHEPLGLCYGIEMVGGFAAGLALTEPDDTAGSQIDGGK